MLCDLRGANGLTATFGGEHFCYHMPLVLAKLRRTRQPGDRAVRGKERREGTEERLWSPGVPRLN
eukprot:9404121-Pyramimonas_sp.AAC.1